MSDKRIYAKVYTSYKSLCDTCNSTLRTGMARPKPKVHGYTVECDGTPIFFVGECCDFDEVHKVTMAHVNSYPYALAQVRQKQSQAV